MRLLEAILDANHRAAAGDTTAGLRPSQHEDELPVVALTCIDPRLNRLLPEVLGLPEEQFIWLRNAGNIITGPLSSTMRSLALACAIKGGRQVLIIGHSDCQVAKTTAMQLIEHFSGLAIPRKLLPDNINEFFALFSSERQNVIRAAEVVRHGPLISPRIPVHGLLVDTESGRLEWLVNGYDTLQSPGFFSRWNEAVRSAAQTVDALKSLADFQIGEMKFPETRIGEKVAQAGGWLEEKIGELQVQPPPPPPIPSAPPPPPAPPKLPLPPPLKPKLSLRRPRQ
jgi:carbonic anhydrase